MIPRKIYISNLELSRQSRYINGCVVECGVWRGGMIAGIADILGSDREYFLFDSFEGLPEVKEIDGEAAIQWQNDKESPIYFNNCKAEQELVQEVIKKSSAKKYHLVKGWFSETLPHYSFTNQIAILRLDGDWYDSTLDCLNYLYPQVAKGGLIIIDDYYTWDGCSRAVHDYFSKHKMTEKIRQTKEGVCYFIKN